MLLTKSVIMKWGKRNKKWYINKGYVLTKLGEEFEVKVEDLTNASTALVDIECDGICNTILTNVPWYNYTKLVREDGKYYCRKCGVQLFAKEKTRKIKLENGLSLEEWCIKNDHNDMLKNWDYELNDCLPNEINYGTAKKYYFKCERGLHTSELKWIYNAIGHQTYKIECDQCKSFEQWCIDNNRQDVLDRWDYELNNKIPIETHSGSHNKYYFKCPRGLHKSESKRIKSFTNGQEGSMDCKKCNSFAQWGIDKFGEDFLEKYWDYGKNINIAPWDIDKSCAKNVYIKCQEKDYHGSYDITCCNFVSNKRCPYCNNHHGNVHVLDSLGTLHPEVLVIWSDKNNKSPYEYSSFAHLKVYWKCLKGIHYDYKRNIGNSTTYNFRCPECEYSKGEESIANNLIKKEFIKISQEDFEQLFEIDKYNKYYYISQKTFDGLIGLGCGNLSYDFYLPKYNLLIEFQGEQHERYIPGFHKTIEDFEKQVEHDMRKREYAEQNNYNLLEIWYWDFDKIEEILKTEVFNIG